jgi:hypothetical protein
MSEEQLRYHRVLKAYQRRWDKIAEVRDDLQTELLEAEVLWGKCVSDQFEPLFKLQQELFADVHAYLVIMNPEEHERSRDAMAEIRRNRREVLYDFSGEAPDAYSKELTDAVLCIEASLKPHLIK